MENVYTRILALLWHLGIKLDFPCDGTLKHKGLKEILFNHVHVNDVRLCFLLIIKIEPKRSNYIFN